MKNGRREERGNGKEGEVTKGGRGEERTEGEKEKVREGATGVGSRKRAMEGG